MPKVDLGEGFTELLPLHASGSKGSSAASCGQLASMVSYPWLIKITGSLNQSHNVDMCSWGQKGPSLICSLYLFCIYCLYYYLLYGL